MHRIKRATETVRHCLQEYPAARNSDILLYVKVIECIDADLPYKPIRELLVRANEHDIPAFESVRRARQKVQATQPGKGGNMNEKEKCLIEACEIVNGARNQTYGNKEEE